MSNERIIGLENELFLKSNAYNALKMEKDRYLSALREIDIHIRSTPEPIDYIVKTLIDNLPEYEG